MREFRRGDAGPDVCCCLLLLPPVLLLPPPPPVMLLPLLPPLLPRPLLPLLRRAGKIRPGRRGLGANGQRLVNYGSFTVE